MDITTAKSKSKFPLRFLPLEGCHTIRVTSVLLRYVTKCNLALLAAVMLISCSGSFDVAPGESVELDDFSDFIFYHPNSPDPVEDAVNPSQRVLNPPLQVAQMILDDAHWQGPSGISISDASLQITPTTVEWKEDSIDENGNQIETTMSAPGFTLSAKAVVSFGQMLNRATYTLDCVFRI
jgi:hypothetical protein